MTRRRSVRLASTLLIAFAALPLSGCVFGSIPTESPAADKPSSSPEPSEDGQTESDLPATLTFEEGNQIPESAHIEWGDGLMTDDGWESVSPDDGNGGWEYGTADGTCTAKFWQGYTSDVEVAPGDDSTSSDAVLGVLLQSDAATVSPHATDGAFSYQVGGNTDVANRQITGQEGDRTWIMAARAFATPGVGVYVIVDCTGGDVNAVLAEVIEKNAIIAS